jgi:hypothetical protein
MYGLAMNMRTMYIANQNIIESGAEAVYMARTKLNMDVIDDPVSYYRKGSTIHTLPPVRFRGEIFPNPAKDLVTYKYNWNKEDVGIFQLSDVYGRVVINIPLDGRNGEISLQLSNYGSGVYFYKAFRNHSEVDFGKISVIH